MTPSLARGSHLLKNQLGLKSPGTSKLLSKATPALLYIDYIEEKGMELFELAKRTGMEGIISKRADSPYSAGRSRAWLKGKQSGFHDGWERPTRREPS